MDKKNAMRRAKRQSKVLEDNFWDCSVCTYRNTAEAFKCLMCDVRKGTSTRKPRMNQALVAQQQAGATGPGGPNSAGNVVPNSNTSSNSGKRRAGSGSGKANSGGSASSRRRSGGPPRFRDIDRSSGQTREVTVNSVTVVITEYRRRAPANVTAAATSDESSDARP